MNTQFEKIYVISLITNKERQEFIKYQFNELGLDFEFIYGIDYYNFQNITFPDVYKYTLEAPKIKGTSMDFGCAMAHYAAVMQAYYLGYNNVLIFEDDVCLNTDKHLIEEMLNNIPNNIGFVEYDLRCLMEIDQNKIINIITSSNDRYKPLGKEVRKYGAAMYGLMNRDIMKLYLDSQRQCLLQSDWVKNFWFDTTIERYISTKCLFIDQLTYEKQFIDNTKLIHAAYDNLYFKCKKYNKTNFFRPTKLHISSRYSDIIQI